MPLSYGSPRSIVIASGDYLDSRERTFKHNERQNAAEHAKKRGGKYQDHKRKKDVGSYHAAAIDGAATETGASSVKDMGKVMALIKERHAGQLDMSKASALVKARLG